MNVLVTQAYVSSIFFLIFWVSAGIGLWYLIKYLHKVVKESIDEDLYFPLFFIFASVSVIVTFIGIIVSLNNFVTMLFNPEYLALTNLISLIPR